LNQVIDLCDQLGVEMKESDFVNVHLGGRCPSLGTLRRSFEFYEAKLRGAAWVEHRATNVHPLPTKKGKAKRVIARFKDHKLGQKVLSSRKNSKDIAQDKKEKLAADPALRTGSAFSRI
jgi:hypothetical protein